MTIPNNNNHHFVLWYNKDKKKWLPMFVDSAESVLHYPCECNSEQSESSGSSGSSSDSGSSGSSSGSGSSGSSSSGSIPSDIGNSLNDILSAINNLTGETDENEGTNLSDLKDEIISGVRNIVKPSGHVFPPTDLFPEWISPKILVKKNISSDSHFTVGGLPNILTDEHSEMIENFDTSCFQNLSYFFEQLGTYQYFYGGSYQVIAEKLDLSGWDTSNVKVLYNFAYSVGLEINELDMSGWDLSNVEELISFITYCGFKKIVADNWDVSNVTNMFQTFYHNTSLREISVKNWDVRKVTTMREVFRDCFYLEELDLSTWDLSYVTDFRGFLGSSSTGKLKKLLWGGSISAPNLDRDSNAFYYCALNLEKTIITPANAELFFNSLSAKTVSHDVAIYMPSTAQGADISIATNKGYTILNITQP